MTMKKFREFQTEASALGKQAVMDMPFTQDTINKGASSTQPQHKRSLEQDFYQFHREHPQVYKTLVFLATDWQNKKGIEAKCSIAMLYEVARWTMDMGVRGSTPIAGLKIQLNNNHKAFYVRMMIQEYPQFEHMFSTRKQKVENSMNSID